MNKKLAVIGVAIIVVGAAVAVWVWRFPSKTGSPSAQNVSALDKLSQEAQTIIQSGDVAKCASINTVIGGVNYETVCRNNIALNLASSSMDINACKALDDKLMSIADCERSVVGKLVAKEKNLAVCDQFVGDLNTACIFDYWSILATTKNDPAQCLNLGSSTSPAVLGCENKVLLSSLTPGTNTPKCSLFTGTVKTDCENYVKDSCQTFTFPPLQQLCLQKRK